MSMSPEEVPRRISRIKRIKCAIKYCLLVLVCILVVVPILLYSFAEDPQVKKENELFPDDFEKRTLQILPWYMRKGVVYPNVTNEERELKIWPDEDDSDRIENQLMYRPSVNGSSVKTILVYKKFAKLNLALGQDSFFGCPVESCSLSDKVEDVESADAVVFSDDDNIPAALKNSRPPQQVWILNLTKNPEVTGNLEKFSGSINWTVSYRSDSDVVAPHQKWVHHSRGVTQVDEVRRNFAAGKTRQAVWFVRDATGDSSRRMDYVAELQKYIDVDVFSQSEDYGCPCSSPQHCFQLLDLYKFFIAFENSHCKDYITEKFFISLRRGVLPLVMGVPADQYLRSAPNNSFIHVDDFSSPRQLAKHLHRLDRDDDLYNAYFRWRGTGEWINTRVECRLCALLHSGRNKTYPDVNLWWKQNACWDK